MRLKELHTIAPNRGQDVDHSPYMISLVVKDDSGTLQLLSKGSPDLITSHCSSLFLLNWLVFTFFYSFCVAYWDGQTLRDFNEEEQHKINDLNNKIIDKGGHCIAFAYPFAVILCVASLINPRYKSVKPIYKVLFEESNFSSPIVDVRVSPPVLATPTSTGNTNTLNIFP